MTIRPVDLPALRDAAVQVAGRLPALHRGTPYASLAAGEAGRLRQAELFHVSEPMCQLAAAAESTLPGFTLRPPDAPAGCGLVYFAEPIQSGRYGGAPGGQRLPLPVTAASWGSAGGNLVVWFYTDPGTYRQVAGARTPALPGMSLAAIQHFADPVVVPWGSEYHTADLPPGVVTRCLAYLLTVWLLMSQPLAEVGEAEFSRAERRRSSPRKPLPPVRVITLRRPAGGGGEAAGRDYCHQWLVRGHWRNQPVGPGRSEIRPVWVSPHVKGPAGAPMLGGEKVYALRQ